MSRTSTEPSPALIELLSPARNLECGIAAIDHGADAVYIGAPHFGARAAAGNSVADIKRLCDYAHPYGAKVYVTVNTILYDDELAEAEALIWQLYEAGVDALIVQDMAVQKMHLPPIPLHASTQMDNRTAEKVGWVASLGYEQVVLARELSLDEMAEIHRQVPSVRLEAFVHGALCVSMSGQCYASQYCFGRSANRGECAQFCRLPFSLVDADGEVLVRDKYLLSLRDMNRSQSLEEMMDAGVRSFKIEGRLKEVTYVKNVTAYYRQCIDRILQRRTDYVRSSMGVSTYTFNPEPSRSFSRGFTDYFLRGRTHDIASMDTPKSRGPKVGTVKEVLRDSLIVSGTASFANGDGLCYFSSDGSLQGFRINRAEGNRLFPAQMPHIERGTTLWRSCDYRWEQLLSRPSASRRIPICWQVDETADGFSLTATLPDGHSFTETFPYAHQLARTSQETAVTETLSRLGDTIYEAQRVDIRFTQPWFIPRSLLAEWRRQTLAKIRVTPMSFSSPLTPVTYREAMRGQSLTYLANVSNQKARAFYGEQGAEVAEMAMEIAPDSGSNREGRVLMFCRYCLRYELNLCPRQAPQSRNVRNPLYLVSQSGKRFQLEFDCKCCQMLIRHV